MPQFDTTTFPSQLFWLVLTFLVLFFFTKYVSVPKISAVLKRRSEKIEGDLNQAEDFHREIEQRQKTLSSDLDNAHSKARAHLVEFSNMMDAEATQRKNEIVQLVHERLKSSENYIRQREAQTAGVVKDIASQVSCVVLEKMLAEKIELSEVEPLIEEMLENNFEEKAV